MSKSSNVFSTGQGGGVFEMKVQTAFLINMLIEHQYPGLPKGKAELIRFQAGSPPYNFETDDIYIELVSDTGTRHKLLVQVKHNLSFTEKNETFAEVIAAAWKDFNSDNFDPAMDRFLVVKGNLSDHEYNNLILLLSWAGFKANAADFLNEASISAKKGQLVNIFNTHLVEANGGKTISENDLWNFIRCFRVTSFDFMSDVSKDKSNFITLIEKSKSRRLALKSEDIWNHIFAFVSVGNPKGASLNYGNLPPVIKSYFEERNALLPVIDSFNRQVSTSSEGRDVFKTIFRELGANSSALLNWDNKLFGIELHIDRAETAQIIEWLFKPIKTEKEKPISVIHGKAGMGKTVIMRDVCEILHSKNIPTLGIRTEIYQAEDIKTLEKSLNFSHSIIKTIEYLADQFPLVVVLFDQIDALSQSSSGHPRFLRTYTQLIWELSEIDNVRIVLSSRTDDLNSDPTLRQYTKSSSFEIKPLDQIKVKEILTEMNIRISGISDKFIELLRVPNHLNVFCRIYKNTGDLNQIKTVQDLYDELWEQITERLSVNSAINADDFTNLAEALAKKLNEEQRLKISNSDFIFDRKKRIRNRLLSEGILIKRDDTLQFFHQTFYEYLFARQFVRSGDDLKNYIIDNHQGLKCRAAVKLILQFYRNKSLEEYINWIRILIFDNGIRFHFKLLALSIFADRENPAKKEQDFLVSDIMSHPRFGALFLKQKKSKEWKLYFIKSGLAKALAFPKDEKINTFEIQFPCEFEREEVVNARWHLFQILHDLTKDKPEVVLNFFKSVPEFEEKPDFVARILYFLKDWSSPDAIELYEKYERVVNKDSFRYFKTLINAVEHQFEWVLTKIYPFLLDEKGFSENFSKDRGYSFSSSKLADKCLETNKIRAFEFFMEILQTVLSNQEENSRKLQSYFRSSYMIDPDMIGERYSGKAIGFVYLKIKQQIVLYSKNEPEKFRTLFKRYYRTKWESIIRLMVYGVLENPKIYVLEMMNLITFIHLKKGFNRYGLTNVQHFLRKALSENASELNSEQWEFLKDLFFSFSNEGSLQIREVEGKRQVFNFIDYDLMLYLQATPEPFLKKDLPVWKKFQELKRRYKSIEDRRVNFLRARAVPPPIPESAYKKMSDENWKRSFKKYDRDYQPDRRNSGGNSFEHGNRFRKCVEKEPEKFLPLIKDLIADESFDSLYVIAGLEGLRDSKRKDLRFQELLKNALNRKLNEEYELKRLLYLIRDFSNKEAPDFELILWLERIFISEDLLENISVKFNKELSADYISTLKEDAVREWMLLQRSKNEKESSFEILDKALELNDDKFCGTVIQHLPYLLHLNRTKCLTLFKKVINSGNEKALEKSLYPLNYLIWDDFEGLLPFVKKIAKNEDLQPQLSEILAIQWIEGKDEAWSVFKEIIDENEKAILKIPEVALYKIRQKQSEYFERSRILFETFLNHSLKEVAHAYDVSFYKLEQEHFEYVKPLLSVYKKSYVAKKIPAAFFRYLNKCVSRYPEEVIELMDFWEHYDSPDIFSEGYDRGEPIQILISIYRHLVDKTGGDFKQRDQVLDMVDKMLENPNLMGTSIETIEKFEIG